MTGLYAAGDVAGGAPQKYVTGALAEGEIAADAIAEDLKEKRIPVSSGNRTSLKSDKEHPDSAAEDIFAQYRAHLQHTDTGMKWQDIEEAMQKVMDEYAGGIRTDYRYNESRLALAKDRIEQLEALATELPANDMFDLLHIYEVRERLTVCRILIEHLKARKETRWHIFGENADYPEQSEKGLLYVNSRLEDGKIRILYRDLVKGDQYEHQN